jgi:hypothetical protein
MVLRVELERFPQEVTTRLSSRAVYLSKNGSGSVATACDPEKPLLIVASTSKTLDEARQSLRDAGLEPIDGRWDERDEGDEPASATAWIAAVAYRTRELKSGLWVDAYDHEPTPAEVVKRLYEEFRETGELAEVAFEEFMKLAVPTIVVVGPEEIQRYVERNAAGEGC